MAKRRGPAWGRIVAAAVLLAALAAAWRWTPLADLVTTERIVGWAQVVRGTWWAPFALVAAYTFGAFLMFPRPLLTLAAVIGFGVWPGVAYATAGVLTAALASYWVGRWLKRDTVRRLAGDKLDALGKLLKEHGIIAVFGANMMPTPPFVVQNIVAGGIRIPLWQFMAGTFLALVPGIIAWTVFGDRMMATLEGGGSKAGYAVMGGAVLLLAAFIWFARRWLKKKGF